jgi:hypothetical protein
MRGTIETRSGTWEWEVSWFRSKSKTNGQGGVLELADPDDELNVMTVLIDPDGEFSEEAVRDLSLAPRKRRFEDEDGNLWIAHPVDRRSRKAPPRISLHNLENGSRVVELPPQRTLGDLRHEELVELI